MRVQHIQNKAQRIRAKCTICCCSLPNRTTYTHLCGTCGAHSKPASKMRSLHPSPAIALNYINSSACGKTIRQSHSFVPTPPPLHRIAMHMHARTRGVFIIRCYFAQYGIHSAEFWNNGLDIGDGIFPSPSANVIGCDTARESTRTHFDRKISASHYTCTQKHSAHTGFALLIWSVCIEIRICVCKQATNPKITDPSRRQMRRQRSDLRVRCGDKLASRLRCIRCAAHDYDFRISFWLALLAERRKTRAACQSEWTHTKKKQRARSAASRSNNLMQ